MEFPRRSIAEKMKSSELAIQKAIDEVEELGADERLTDAVIKLSEAKDFVSDYIDDKA